MAFRRWALGAILGLAPVAAFAQVAPGLDARAFTEAVAELYQSAAPGAPIAVSRPLEIAIGARKTPLDALFAQCQQERAGCAAAVERQARGAAEGESVATMAQLRIAVRPSAFVDQLGGDPIAEPLVDDLWIVGLKDQPSRVATLDAKDLGGLGLDGAGALKAGERNLEARFRGALDGATKTAARGVGVLRGDDYMSGLVASPDLWTSLAEGFDGSLYVAAPATNVVLFVDGREKDAMARLTRAIRAEMILAARPVSAAALAWSPSGWDVVGKASDAAP